MNIFKKFNLLDYIILIAILFVVFFGIYSLIPKNQGNDYRIYISLSEDLPIKNGDLCTDFSAELNMGDITLKSEKEFFVSIKGKKSDHGIKSEGKIYLENMPISLYIGDLYAFGKIREIERVD